MTTALSYYLEEHPQVCFSRVKEIHYFNRYYHKGDDWYRGFFSHRQGEPAVGEASTRYMSDPATVERMHRYNPDFKLIFCLRDPVARAYSEYWHEIQNRGTRVSFDDVIRESDRLLLPGRYYTHLRRFLDYFPADQLHVVFYNDLASDTASQLASICCFLGIDPSFCFTRVGVKGIKRSAMPRSLRLQHFMWAHLRNNFDDPLALHYVKKGLRRVLIAANRTRHSAFPPVSADARAYLERVYAEEMSSLASLLGRELPWSS